MISLEKIKKDDSSLKNLPDDELLEVINSFYELTNLAFSCWHKEKFGSKNPIGSLTNKSKVGIIN